MEKILKIDTENKITDKDLDDLFNVLKNQNKEPNIDVKKDKNENGKLSLKDLKNGKRLFFNKNEYTGYDFIDESYIEFRQLLFPNLLLNEHLEPNNKERFSLQSCLISTFVYDSGMIEGLFEKFKVKCIIVKDKSTNDKNKHGLEKINENLYYVHPVIDFNLNWGKFHSKLMILKFEEFVRIVIPSANMTNVNWYYLGECIWFQDFYLGSGKSDFIDYLEKYVINKYFETFKISLQNIDIDLSKYDFSSASVDLISTVSGRFKTTSQDSKSNLNKFVNKNHANNENELNSYGLCRVSFLLNEMKLDSSMDNLFIQCSSIGNINDKWLDEIKKSFKTKDINFIFPSINLVNSINDGENLASSLFLNKDTYNLYQKLFRKLDLKDSNKKRFKNQIFHSKIFVGKNELGKFIYAGSHNFSQSAWGKYEKNNTQICSANYELGVLFRSDKLSKDEIDKIEDSLQYNTINSILFNNEDKDKPWLSG